MLFCSIYIALSHGIKMNAKQMKVCFYINVVSNMNCGFEILRQILNVVSRSFPHAQTSTSKCMFNILIILL